MPSSNAGGRYDAVAQAFHWLIVALVAIQFVIAKAAMSLPLGLHKLILFARHKSFGMTILMLAVLRLAWRLRHPPPPLPHGMTAAERILAHATHTAFYVLLIAMPLTGWMMSSAKNYSVSWFGLFTWPNLIRPDEAAFKLLRETHDLSSNLLLAIVVLHVLAALKHQFWNKNDALLRMLPLTRSKRRS